MDQYEHELEVKQSAQLQKQQQQRLFELQQIQQKIVDVNESDLPIKAKIAELKKLDEQIVRLMGAQK